MAIVSWNYGSVEKTPKQGEDQALIIKNHVSDQSLEIGMDEVDELIHDLQQMKSEWETNRHNKQES